MNKAFKEMAKHADAAKDILIHMKEVNPRFYNEFVREFLTDRLTLTNFEKDLVDALHAIAGITVFVEEGDINKIKVQHGTIVDTFDDYESAFRFAIALLNLA